MLFPLLPAVQPFQSGFTPSPAAGASPAQDSPAHFPPAGYDLWPECGKSEEMKMMGKGIKNTLPLGKTKPNLRYTFLESHCGNGCCLKCGCRQCFPVAGEWWGMEGTEGTKPALRPLWPSYRPSTASVLVSDEVTGQGKAIFLSSANSA